MGNAICHIPINNSHFCFVLDKLTQQIISRNYKCVLHICSYREILVATNLNFAVFQTNSLYILVSPSLFPFSLSHYKFSALSSVIGLGIPSISHKGSILFVWREL